MAGINRNELRRALSDVETKQRLLGDRTIILAGAVATVASAILLVYMSFSKDRLELVYLEQDKIDVPTLLNKVRSESDAVRSDRWVRGFARRFLAYYFLSPDDSKEFAKKSVAWLHAHTGPAGKGRSESFWHDFEKYNEIRKKKLSSFFPVNDPTAVKIRQSSEDASLIFVELPGTYVTKTEQGESFFDARLKLVVQKTPISGIESDLGEVNATGLIVLNGVLEFVEDYTRPGETTRWPIFQEEK